MEWKHVFIAIMLLAAVKRSEAADAMMLLATGFVSVMEDCQKELNLNDGLFNDFYMYWKQDFTSLNRDTGCAFICMSHKLNLLTNDGKLHHGSIKEYAMKNGADDQVASEIVGVLHSCEMKNESIEDECGRALELAKCSRVGLHNIHWEPNEDVLVTSMLTEL